MELLFEESRLLPGEGPFLTGDPSTWIWRPYYGWVHSPGERERVPLQGLKGKNRLRRWLEPRLARAPQLPYPVVLVFVTRTVESDYIEFGLMLRRYVAPMPTISIELSRHLVRPKTSWETPADPERSPLKGLAQLNPPIVITEEARKAADADLQIKLRPYKPRGPINRVRRR
jgi:hypothetical protein